MPRLDGFAAKPASLNSSRLHRSRQSRFGTTRAGQNALLGAAALGDIGKHFPDSDVKYKGADSLMLMREVRRILQEHYFLIGNVDATIIAQAPKMRPHIDRMRQNIAEALELDISQVSVKATTEEWLGFTGRGEGISVQAVALITSPMDLEANPVFSSDGGCANCPARQ